MSEFVKDVQCSKCGFPGASLYADTAGEFTDCGNCNFNSRRGDSPTPERMVFLDWDGLQAWTKAEADWLGIDERTFAYLRFDQGARDMAQANAEWLYAEQAWRERSSR